MRTRGLPIIAFVMSLSAGAAAMPRLGVYGFSGPDAAATAEKLIAAFRTVGGVEVVPPEVVAVRLRTASVRNGWLQRAEDVRRVLAKIDVDLLLSGKLRREGTRQILIVFLRSARTGKIVSAARVERTGEFDETARRMTLRLRNLAFAALAIPLPGEPVAVATREPTAEDEVPAEPNDEPPAEPGEPPAAPSTPAAIASVPTAPVAVAAKAEPTAELPWFVGRAGLGVARWSRSDVASTGMIAEVGVAFFPGARSDVGFARDIGIDFTYETSIAFQSFDGTAGTTPGDSLQYLRFRPGVKYRWRVGEHEIETHAAYELRDLRARTGAGATSRDQLFTLRALGTIDLGSRLRLSPSFAISPWGAYSGPAGHRFGVAGGVSFFADLSGFRVGIRYRAEYLLGSADIGPSGSSFNEMMHFFGVFAGARF
jgi:hypothetical protein